MPHVIGVRLIPHDLPGRVVPDGRSKDGAGEIKRSESALAQQKPVFLTVGSAVKSNDLPGVGLGGEEEYEGDVYPRLRLGALGYYMTPLAELSKEVDIFFFFDGAEDSSDSLSQPATNELANPGI
jgi:hypothetical protein